MDITEQQVFFRAGTGAIVYRDNQILMFRRTGFTDDQHP